MEVYKNPLLYGIISGLITYVYLNYASSYYIKNNKYNLLYPMAVFIAITILSTFIVNNYLVQNQDGGTADLMSPIFSNCSKMIGKNITLPKSIDDLPDIFIKIP
jgi:hypothetical protein